MVTLCPIAYVLRGGPDHKRHGDPYSVVGTVIDAGPGVARIVGVEGPIYQEFPGEVFAMLAGLGFETVMWERYRPDGSIKTVVHQL